MHLQDLPLNIIMKYKLIQSRVRHFSPVFSGVAFFAFLAETGVFVADSFGLFFPKSAYKTYSQNYKIIAKSPQLSTGGNTIMKKIK